MSAENHSGEFEAWWKVYPFAYEGTKYACQQAFLAGVLAGRLQVLARMPTETQAMDKSQIKFMNYATLKQREYSHAGFIYCYDWLRDRLLGEK